MVVRFSINIVCVSISLERFTAKVFASCSLLAMEFQGSPRLNSTITYGQRSSFTPAFTCKFYRRKKSSRGITKILKRRYFPDLFPDYDFCWRLERPKMVMYGAATWCSAATRHGDSDLSEKRVELEPNLDQDLALVSPIQLLLLYPKLSVRIPGWSQLERMQLEGLFFAKLSCKCVIVVFLTVPQEKSECSTSARNFYFGFRNSKATLSLYYSSKQVTHMIPRYLGYRLCFRGIVASRNFPGPNFRNNFLLGVLDCGIARATPRIS
ncbi:hypothetical protein V8E53_012733 [Lactarius tabidus]